MTSIKEALIALEQRRSPEMTAAVEQLQANGTLSPDARTSQRGSPTPAAVPESPEKATPDAYPQAGNTLVLHVSDTALFAAGFALGLAVSLIVCGICAGLAS